VTKESCFDGEKRCLESFFKSEEKAFNSVCNVRKNIVSMMRKRCLHGSFTVTKKAVSTVFGRLQKSCFDGEKRVISTVFLP